MKISILGAAGTVGSCTAFNIAVQGLAEEIVMLDTQPAKLTQHVGDLNTAMTGRDIIVRQGTGQDIADSDIVIISAAAQQANISSRREVLPVNLPVILEAADMIKQYSPGAIAITATVPIEPLNYTLFRRTGIDRHKLLGYTLNDSFRMRRWVAQELGVKTSQVEGYVLGEHGDSQVMLFSSLKINGKMVPLSDELKRSIKDRPANVLKQSSTIKVGRTTGWTSAVGISAMVRAIRHDTGEMFPCSVVLQGEYGCYNLSMGVPVILGKDGVKEILEWKLAPDEQADLEKTIEVIKTLTRYVDENMGNN